MDMPMQQQQAEQPEQPSGEKQIAYSVELCVYTDGTYRVSKESADQETAEHEATGTEMGEGGQDFDKLGDALQGILEIVKANPAGEDAGAQFEAGFGEGA